MWSMKLKIHGRLPPQNRFSHAMDSSIRSTQTAPFHGSTCTVMVNVNKSLTAFSNCRQNFRTSNPKSCGPPGVSRSLAVETLFSNSAATDSHHCRYFLDWNQLWSLAMKATGPLYRDGTRPGNRSRDWRTCSPVTVGLAVWWAGRCCFSCSLRRERNFEGFFYKASNNMDIEIVGLQATITHKRSLNFDILRLNYYIVMKKILIIPIKIRYFVIRTRNHIVGEYQVSRAW